MLDPSHPNYDHIQERLRSNVVIWLNSVRPDGRPHSVIVWYLWDGEKFLIFSRPKNQKLRNIQHNPHVVLALDNTDDGDDPIIFEGTAELVDPAKISATMPAYKEKYTPQLQEMGFTAEAMAADYSQPIVVTPTRLASG